MNEISAPLVPAATVLLLRKADPQLQVFMVVRHHQIDFASGALVFPGGKLEPGETPETALVRELEEELGIRVAPKCLAPLTFASHGYDTFHLLMPLFACRKWEGEVAARQGQELAWVRAKRLGDYEMPPADEPLKAMLRDLL